MRAGNEFSCSWQTAFNLIGQDEVTCVTNAFSFATSRYFWLKRLPDTSCNRAYSMAV